MDYPNNGKGYNGDGKDDQPPSYDYASPYPTKSPSYGQPYPPAPGPALVPPASAPNDMLQSYPPSQPYIAPQQPYPTQNNQPQPYPQPHPQQQPHYGYDPSSFNHGYQQSPPPGYGYPNAPSQPPAQPYPSQPAAGLPPPQSIDHRNGGYDINQLTIKNVDDITDKKTYVDLEKTLAAPKSVVSKLNTVVVLYVILCVFGFVSANLANEEQPLLIINFISAVISLGLAVAATYSIFTAKAEKAEYERTYPQAVYEKASRIVGQSGGLFFSIFICLCFFINIVYAFSNRLGLEPYIFISFVGICLAIAATRILYFFKYPKSSTLERAKTERNHRRQKAGLPPLPLDGPLRVAPYANPV